jgi:hypothetical protein
MRSQDPRNRAASRALPWSCNSTTTLQHYESKDFSMKTGINNISPNPAPAGTTVEIKGVGFEHLDKLFFGDQEVPFEVIDDARLRAQVPNGSGRADVTVEWARPFLMRSKRSFEISSP